MKSTSVSVALIGRNSRCKSLFLQAACTSNNPLPDSTLQTEAWWTVGFAPKEADLAQAPVHGFSPLGERLLPAQLRHVSAAEVVGEEGKCDADGCGPPPVILLVVSADVVFHKGRPRPSRGGVTSVKAAVSRARERLGGGGFPLAVAVSVDVEDDERHGGLLLPLTKAFLSAVKDEMASEGVPVVPVSPRTELWLREQQSEGGRVSYRRGDSHFRVRPAFEQLMDKNDIARARSAFDVTSGGTGILAAVSAAVALDPPTLVFPVADFVTLQSLGWSGDGAPAAQLRTCRVLRANSTARDVFAIEKEDGVLSGELIGAEALAASADLTQAQNGLPLDVRAPIGKGAWVIRLETNRRAAQMWKTKTAVAPGGKVGKPLASVQFGDLRSKERRRGKS